MMLQCSFRYLKCLLLYLFCYFFSLQLLYLCYASFSPSHRFFNISVYMFVTVMLKQYKSQSNVLFLSAYSVTYFIFRKLLVQLESFKNASAPEKKQKSSAITSPEDTVKYELYVKPDQAKLEQASKVKLISLISSCLILEI